MERRTMLAASLSLIGAALPGRAQAGKKPRCRCRAERDTIRDARALAVATQGYFAGLEAALDAAAYDHDLIVQYRNDTRRYLIEVVERLAR